MDSNSLGEERSGTKSGKTLKKQIFKTVPSYFKKDWLLILISIVKLLNGVEKGSEAGLGPLIIT